jgi:sec-independent protein translocase protein TatB
MYDVGFNELALIFVIGLLVLGPEKLPRIAAQAGRWVARARRMANQLRYQLEHEITLEEIERGRQSQPKAPDADAAEAAAAESEFAAGAGRQEDGAGSAESPSAAGNEPVSPGTAEQASPDVSGPVQPSMAGQVSSSASERVSSSAAGPASASTAGQERVAQSPPTSESVDVGSTEARTVSPAPARPLGNAAPGTPPPSRHASEPRAAHAADDADADAEVATARHPDE